MSMLNLEPEFKTSVQHLISEIATYKNDMTAEEALRELCDRIGVKLDEENIANRIATIREALESRV